MRLDLTKQHFQKHAWYLLEGMAKAGEIEETPDYQQGIENLWAMYQTRVLDAVSACEHNTVEQAGLNFLMSFKEADAEELQNVEYEAGHRAVTNTVEMQLGPQVFMHVTADGVCERFHSDEASRSMFNEYSDTYGKQNNKPRDCVRFVKTPEEYADTIEKSINAMAERVKTEHQHAYVQVKRDHDAVWKPSHEEEMAIVTTLCCGADQVITQLHKQKTHVLATRVLQQMLELNITEHEILQAVSLMVDLEEQKANPVPSK